MYTRVESRFWQDEKMRAVSDDVRYLMLYLLTSPHRNIIGFYFLPLPYACFDLGWDEKRFMKALQELLSAGLIRYDKQVHVVLVKNYLKHNPLENPNQVKSAIEKIKEIPETPLFQDFLEIVKQLDKPLYKPLIEHLHKRLPKPGTGSGTGTGSGSGSGEEDSPNPPGPDAPQEPHVPLDDNKNEPKYTEDSPPYRAAIYLRNRILENNPRARVPDDDPGDPLLQKWAQEMDRLHRLGPPGGDQGYNWHEIRQLIDFSQDDEFWRANILSAGKLREKCVQLENQMKRNAAKARGHPTMSKNVANALRLVEKYNQEEGGYS
ncbi:hypothetical protein ODU73_000407 [Thermoclostridium stercorarium]|uniref:hypothetical protein n=1 Tax=Thermoclostridium stercorarium TaxID=1510 RepID=UPI0022497F03|nr:hypothetical protein [Thermoclostridium stercorarium]UZQ86014.1 hypothetical protein ODU73_000407 [Thermoclostridium stercorarium]